MKIIFLLFVLFLTPFVSAYSDVKRCAKVALYSERDAIFKATSNLGLEIGSNGTIQSPGDTWVSQYSNNNSSTKLKFKNGTEIIFEKSAEKKVKSVSNGIRRSTFTEDCKLDQTVANSKDLLYDRQVCLKFAELYQRMGMKLKQVFACGDLIKSVAGLVKTRNQELQISGLSIPEISANNPLEVSGFVFTCADQLSFEKIEDGVIKGTLQPYTQGWLDSAFSLLKIPDKRANDPASSAR